MRAKEFSPRKLVIFDIDDTLVHTQTKVRVIRNGKVVKELNSHDFTHYKLQPGEEFDFENFRNAQEFFNNSKPIIPMMNQLKQDIATGNKVVMVTARADFDDRELFLDTFRKYGVDMGKVHVYRAGNMTQKVQTEEKKKIIIRNLLDKGNYTKAIMYDDAVPNLTSFVELKDEYANTKFYAWHVSLEGEASEFHRTNEQVQPDLNETVISEDAVMGKIADSGKIIRILKKAHTVPFSDEKNWLLVDMDPAKGNSGLGIKWIPADTRFEWVRPYRDTVDENFADGQNPGRKELDPNVYEDLSNSIIARIARQIVPTIRAKSTPEGYVYLSTEDGLSLVIGCNIAGGSIDINIGSQPMETTSSGPHKGAVTKIIAAVYQAAVKRYGTPTEQGTLSIDHDAGHGVWQHIAQRLGLQYDAHMVKENFANPAKAYRAHLIKTLPQIMKLFANIGKGWIPSKEQMLSAVDNAYQVMKHTGDAKQAGKVLMDELNTLYRMSKNKQDVAENFADGRNPQDKGDAKRHGVPTKGSVSSLRNVAKQGGRKGQLAHWMANMKAGKAKNK